MGLLSVYDDYQKKMAMMKGQPPSVGTPPYVPSTQPQMGTGLLGMFDRIQTAMQPQPTVQVPDVASDSSVANLGMTPPAQAPSMPAQLPNTQQQSTSNELLNDQSGLRKMLFRFFGS